VNSATGALIVPKITTVQRYALIGVKGMIFAKILNLREVTMRAKSIVAILAIGGLLVFIAVSVLGGSKDRAASPSTTLRGVEGRVQPQIGDRYSISSPLGTKAVPQQINYQGYLVKVEGTDTSAVTGNLEMTFRIYDEETGGSELWWETQSVSVENGLFNVLLGTPDSLFTGQALWLETTVGGETLSPRKKLVSVPYAFKDDIWASTNDDCYFDKSGSVVVGTGDLLNHKGKFIAHGYGVIPNGHQACNGVLGIMHCTADQSLCGYGVLGIADGQLATGVGGIGPTGVYGEGYSGGPLYLSTYGVYGKAGDAGYQGSTYGVYGKSGAGYNNPPVQRVFLWCLRQRHRRLYLWCIF